MNIEELAFYLYMEKQEQEENAETEILSNLKQDPKQ